ncbi:MAG: zinc ribbon domain-containing protein [Candidatus Levybacteria bacterium]|nr:zinc ribbon domain-containing protein [Candidatus Levybacteria bacterium]
MNRFKDLFYTILGIVIFIAFIVVTALLLVHGYKIAKSIFPILVNVTGWATLISLVVFLPSALFNKTRIISVWGLFLASYTFGVSLWVYGFLITYFYWGVLGIVFGLLFMGIGVVPLGIVASLFHADWSTIGTMVYMFVLTYGSRALALYLERKLENQQLETGVVISDHNNNEDVNYCSSCGKKNQLGSNYCKFCGSKL